jgi:ribosomal protein S18 acetylase RimI-like enzyme
MNPNPDIAVTIRSFRREDADACRRLYREGLLGGKLAPNDTGLDIDNIESAYMSSPRSHFWVAELPGGGDAVGMIGVQMHEEQAAEIRRLRVKEDVRRRGIGTRLVETAVKFCADQQVLKVALDTWVDRDLAIKMFEKFRFRLDRTKKVGEKDLLFFYLDIYGKEQKK